MNDRLFDIECEALRLSPPTFVAHVEDVAVAAIQVAATGHLEQNGVDHCHERWNLAVVSIVRSIVASRNIAVFVPDFLDQAREHHAVDFRAERRGGTRAGLSDLIHGRLRSDEL